MMVEYSGRTTCYSHKRDDWKDHPITEKTNKGLSKVWFLDAQWSTCPVEVEQEIKELWRYYELGNDKYILKTSVNDLLEMSDGGFMVERWYWGASEAEKRGWVEEPGSVEAIVQYIREHKIRDDEQVIIHWWW